MITRILGDELKKMLEQYPVVTITGPRQSGKTTLAKSLLADKPYLNFENLETREFARQDPIGFLNKYPTGAIIDEIQLFPELLSYIQVTVDEKKQNGMYVLTGSQQLELMKSVSQSLAGRTALLKLLPFSLEEIKEKFKYSNINEYILRGFYPRIYDQNQEPAKALAYYFETYVERDIRQLAQIHNLNLFAKFVKICAGRVGQLLNISSLANDVGVSHTTAREWLDILQTGYIVFLLEPYHANIGKRLIKAPKLYFYDVGLACNLLGIEDLKQLEHHPLYGNIYENMVVMEFLKYRYNRGQKNNLNFYRDAKGNEVDVIYNVANKLIPVEIKSGQTINSDFFKGIKNIKSVFPEQIQNSILVYGGDKYEKHNDVLVGSVFDVKKLLTESVG